MRDLHDISADFRARARSLASIQDMEARKGRLADLMSELEREREPGMVLIGLKASMYRAAGIA